MTSQHFKPMMTSQHFGLRRVLQSCARSPKAVGLWSPTSSMKKIGYLALTQEEHDKAKLDDPTIKMYARQLLEYGEAREGYWTSEKFMAQIKEAVKIAEVKYPRSEGYRIVWIFDHSSCHAAMPSDALDVRHMNVNPGGKQRVMHDGWWGGKPPKMNFALGVPKGLRAVLQEKGVNTSGLSADEMRRTLASHPDFKNEKSSIERYLVEERGHISYMLPKYHCELNPIERVWAQAKRHRGFIVNTTSEA